jgi:hypothetical protein
MDARGSSLIVGLYVLAALVIAAIVGVGLSWQRGNLREQLAREAEAVARQRNGPSGYLSRNALTRQEYLAAQSAAEAERLRRLLDEKNKQLEERTAVLRQRTAEYQRLQKQFDAAATLALQTLIPFEATFATDAATEDIAIESAENLGSELEATAATGDSARLREELNKARLLENALSEEIEQLQVEVLAAETEIARIQQEARTQADDLLATERLMREAAGETLVRVGEAAVPALAEALRDENPAVRRWAALVLAELGPNAPSAIPPLMDALTDRDETVRTAAAQALRAVSAGE